MFKINNLTMKKCEITTNKIILITLQIHKVSRKLSSCMEEGLVAILAEMIC